VGHETFPLDHYLGFLARASPGTPKGRNEFFRIYEEALANPERWFSLKLKASENSEKEEAVLAT
jgi:hypothetical protein